MTRVTEIEITREEYERLWGIVPPGNAVSVKMIDPNSLRPSVEYKFVGKTHEEIQDLERLMKDEPR